MKNKYLLKSEVFNTVHSLLKKTEGINFREASLLSYLFILFEDLELQIVFIIFSYSLLTRLPFLYNVIHLCDK